MKTIMDIYYKIWIDCIVRLRSIKSNRDNWVEWSMFSMSIAMILNFILIMSILEKHILRCYFYKLSVSSLSEEANNALSILVLFVLPCVTVNYLLIFRKKRCKKLIKKYKYPYYNGKLSLAYIIVSLLLPIVLLFIYIIRTQDVTFWDFFGM